ncbi:COG2958 family protein [Clostridium sp.]|jgi:hypothetical protein|uniref:COG2958 family protein n=1 Tax=Clostridium sp. TaxID=1506 RepID=UPI0025B9EB71|nr:HTH domain-containing protein [Clostridium sp.]MCI9069313.1 hypothetical protein [Clostridium sp.]MCI9302783.1 hypothetical protein [Clostridium sp.]
MTLKELAIKILNESEAPMSAEELWNYAVKKGYDSLVNVNGRTPWQTISAQIYVDMKDKDNSRFIKVGRRPIRFFLNNLYESKHVDKCAIAGQKIMKNKLKYSERDLHKLLTYYAYNYMRIHTRTIYHEKSKRKDKGANEWLHPDLVGFYFPLRDWNKQVLELSNNIGSTPIRIYSFEMKKELDFINIRSAFFQTVSNSSWANESYLVAANISGDSDFLDELKRLSASFGIGVIRLDVNKPDDSTIIYPARYKTELDWDTVNKLIEENNDFKEFISDINACIKSNRIYDTAYDEIYDVDGLIRFFSSADK